ncbi:IS110 family transposase [Microbispora sp. NBC_01389]|uniref:IS110 family transposase n=1 Tax=Microbispora sp. NBC_01389 TaxID=2903584 RepID=UPI00324397D7
MNTDDAEGPLEIVQRVCAIDIAKADLVACVRVPHDTDQGKRVQEIREFTTLTASLLRLADWLRSQQVELVAMEATSSYWKPVFYLLEAEGFTCWLLNAKHVKNVPGRPKTDRLDAVWLAKVVERGMCRPSLVQPAPIRQLRDLTRYRRTLVRDRSREKQRLEKLLEDAQIKLSSVIEDLCGVSGRQMLEALINGERNPSVLAQMARGRMRSKIPVLEEALRGHFQEHHAFLTRMMLDRIDEIDTKITQVAARIEELIMPFASQAEQLDEITGVGVISARELIAEIGVNMAAFPTAAHLVSWAKFAPIDKNSGGKKRGGSTGKGNPWLAATLGEVVAAVSHTDSFLGERYRRLSKRRGKSRAIVAVGNSVLTIIWHLLSDPQARFHDLGSGFYQSRINHNRQERTLIRQLERLTGRKVTLTDLAHGGASA